MGIKSNNPMTEKKIYVDRKEVKTKLASVMLEYGIGSNDIHKQMGDNGISRSLLSNIIHGKQTKGHVETWNKILNAIKAISGNRKLHIEDIYQFEN